MKRNIVFWIGVKSDSQDLLKKHGNFEYFEYSKLSWQYWCLKNNVIFHEYTTPTMPDTYKHRVTWQRWFDLEKELSSYEWEKVLLIDASTIVRWDTPNIFELAKDQVTAFRSLENINWINQGIIGYQHLFSDVKFDLKKYINCGFQILTKEHVSFLRGLYKFYMDNLDEILRLQSTINRGTDQPIYNFLLQQYNINVNYDLSPSFFLMHMNRFNWFNHNWQLNEDKTPYFIKYGYIWVFSGFDRTQRNELMKQTWEITKHNYE